MKTRELIPGFFTMLYGLRPKIEGGHAIYNA